VSAVGAVRVLPHQRHGYERCDGRTATTFGWRTLAGRATVLAATVVKLHADPRRTAPFTVLRLRLDDGPVVRAVAADGAEVVVGGRVEAVLVPVPGCRRAARPAVPR